jgi:peptidoglycan-N-acetylglucosamine deacetylase
MGQMANKRIWFTGGCAVLLSFVLSYGPIDRYIDAVKHQTVPVDRPLQEDERLRALIEQWKQGREEAPINARIDSIWKAVPGYNGHVVDIEASLANMKMTRTPGPESLVFKEVPPAVTLEQLGPHPVYRGNEKKPALSFMINVAWGNEYLDSILDTLDKHGVKTTFFLDGSWVKRYPEWAKKIAARGHEIGNHAYSHPDMSRLGRERIRQEIGRTQEVIGRTLGVKPVLFAPPSGAFNQSVVDIAHNDFQMKTILWTADTIDWQKPSVDVLIRRIEAKMGNGVLVLMHPTAPTAAGLDALIRMAKQKGLVPTTVSEVISSRRLP